MRRRKPAPQGNGPGRRKQYRGEGERTRGNVRQRGRRCDSEKSALPRSEGTEQQPITKFRSQHAQRHRGRFCYPEVHDRAPTRGPRVTPLAFVEPESADGEVVGDGKRHCLPEHVADLVLGRAAFGVCLPTPKAWDQRSSPRPSPPTSQAWVVASWDVLRLRRAVWACAGSTRSAEARSRPQAWRGT